MRRSQSTLKRAVLVVLLLQTGCFNGEDVVGKSVFAFRLLQLHSVVRNGEFMDRDKRVRFELPNNLYGTDFQTDPGDHIRHLWLDWKPASLLYGRKPCILHFYYQRIVGDPGKAIADAIDGDISTTRTLGGQIKYQSPIRETKEGHQALLRHSSAWNAARTIEVRYVIKQSHLLKIDYGYLSELSQAESDELGSTISQLVRSFDTR